MEQDTLKISWTNEKPLRDVWCLTALVIVYYDLILKIAEFGLVLIFSI